MLSDEHQLLRDSLRDFAQQRLAPFAAEWDRNATFPRDALRELAALGCYGIAVPDSYGGAGMDYLALAIALEEIAAGDGATSTIISVNNCPVCSILMAWGNEDQKRRYLVPLARGEMLGAFCLTEPHVGSEASGLRDERALDALDALWLPLRAMPDAFHPMARPRAEPCHAYTTAPGSRGRPRPAMKELPCT